MHLICFIISDKHRIFHNLFQDLFEKFSFQKEDTKSKTLIINLENQIQSEFHKQHKRKIILIFIEFQINGKNMEEYLM